MIKNQKEISEDQIQFCTEGAVNPVFNTIHWSMTVGINSGYHLEDQKDIGIEAFAADFQEIAEQVHTETGIYITGTVVPSRTVYSQAFGCPKTGEISYTASGSCNPEFAAVAPYMNALRIVTKRLKEHYHQATILLEIMPAHLEYLKD